MAFGPKRAVLIWAMDRCDPSDIELITQHVSLLESCPTWDIQIYGPICIGDDNYLKDYYIDVPTYAILKDKVFDHSWMIDNDPSSGPNPEPGFLTGDYERAWAVIFDHSWMVEGQFRFNGSDMAYMLPYSDLRGWLENECNPNNMCLTVMGGRSGRALLSLHVPKPNWNTITSMHKDENVEDGFNLARRLNCTFNWRVAYLLEKDHLQGYQTPQILPL